MQVDLEPAAQRLCDLVTNVPNDALDNPTPCGYSVGTLLDHLATFAIVFTEAANKDVARTMPPPAPDARRLDADWRTAIPRDLRGLADAWSHPEAWTGTTKIRGMEFPGEAAGTIALDEVILHSWDLARATGQAYDPDPQWLDALMGFLNHMAEPGMIGAREGLFGPVLAVPDDAPQFDRVLGLAGRDPSWSPH
jgi:uncharacterized protein (TIGR03086 family)